MTDDDDDHSSSLSITPASYELSCAMKESPARVPASAKEILWATLKPPIRQAATTTIILHDRPSRSRDTSLGF